MRRKAIQGSCKICGKQGELTFEHVPPRAAFNGIKYAEISPGEVIKLVSDENRMPWDINGLDMVYKQGGVGGYYLCKTCNNSFGAWYIKEYIRFANTFHNILVESQTEGFQRLTFRIYQFRPLPIFKEIMTMFCDINNSCFNDNELRNFLLTRDARQFNKERYKVFAYLWGNGFPRRNSLTAMVLSSGQTLLVSEISSYPLGFVLSIDHSGASPMRTFEITDMVDYDYNDVIDMDFDLYLNQCQTPFPLDYRTQSEILSQSK